MSIDFDEEKRRLQQMKILAVEQIKAKQELNYQPKRQVRDLKKLLITVGICAVIFLVLAIVIQSMNP